MADTLEKLLSEAEDVQPNFIFYEILSYPSDFTLQGLYLKWTEKQIVVPSFQRQYVWTQNQASRLIESFLLGLPVPGIFFYNEKEKHDLLVLDGQQRLMSVFGYFNGKFPGTNRKFMLTGVHPKWDGKLFSELKLVEQRKLQDAVLRATIVDQRRPKDNTGIFHIFERLNTGGTTLKAQEVRNCVYRGSFNDLLNELNQFEGWRKIFGRNANDKRMRDVELILRFFALHDGHQRYQKPMKDFLSNYMAEKQNARHEKLKHYKNLFENTIEKTIKFLGEQPFNLRKGLNVAAFDAVMIALARYEGNGKDLKAKYQKLINNSAFIKYTTDATTDVDTVKNRIALAHDFLSK